MWSRSDTDEMDFDHRPLAEALVGDPAQRAPNRFAHSVVIAPRPGRQLLDRALDSIAQKRSSRGCRSFLDQPDQADLGRCREAAPPVENYRGDGAAVQGDATPV